MGQGHREAQMQGFLEAVTWDLSLKGQDRVNQVRQGDEGPTDWSHMSRAEAGPSLFPAPSPELAQQTWKNQNDLPWGTAVTCLAVTCPVVM